LFGTKTLVLVSKWFSDAPPKGEGVSKKLLNIKTVRFYGKGLFEYEQEWFMFKKLFGTKTLVLVSKWFLYAPPSGGHLKN
jgi:hypothetical protein